jgi:hypothetical protein
MAGGGQAPTREVIAPDVHRRSSLGGQASAGIFVGLFFGMIYTGIWSNTTGQTENALAVKCLFSTFLPMLYTRIAAGYAHFDEGGI